MALLTKQTNEAGWVGDDRLPDVRKREGQSSALLQMNYTPLALIPSDVRRMAVAVHEAGHALVAVILKRDVSAAILRPNGLSGETQMEDAPPEWLDPNTEEGARKIMHAVIVLVAGELAEALYWNTNAGTYDPYVNSHRIDQQEIYELLSDYPGDRERVPYIEHCKSEAKKMITDPQSAQALKRIAQVLFEHYKIDRAEIDQILGEESVI